MLDALRTTGMSGYCSTLVFAAALAAIAVAGRRDAQAFFVAAAGTLVQLLTATAWFAFDLRQIASQAVRAPHAHGAHGQVAPSAAFAHGVSDAAGGLLLGSTLAALLLLAGIVSAVLRTRR